MRTRQRRAEQRPRPHGHSRRGNGNAGKDAGGPRHGLLAVAVCVLAVQGVARAGIIFDDDFETLNERWGKNIRGGGEIEIVPGGVEGNCLKVTTEGGQAYLTTRLDPEEYAGTTLEVAGMVKLEDVKMGQEMWATAKLHIATTVGPEKTVRNYAERWVGTADWAEKQLVAELDEDIGSIVLDLGIQNGSGTVYYDNLVVRDTFGKGRPISLLPICNLGRSDGVAGDGRGSFLDLGMNDLFELPGGNLETESVTFTIPPDGVNKGQTCAILRGQQRPNLPAATAPLPIGKRVGSLHFLHAAAWADTGTQEPCLTYEIEYTDGEKASLEMRAGVEIANFDDPRDFANCKIVWQATNGAGKRVGVGMTAWQNPRPEVAVKSLAVRSAGKGVPIVLAVTYLPAKPQP